MVEVVEVEDGKGFQQVDDSIEGEQLQMEDDIEKEIAALEIMKHQRTILTYQT